MFKKLIAIALVTLMLHVTYSQTALAHGTPEKEARFAEKVKSGIAAGASSAVCPIPAVSSTSASKNVTVPIGPVASCSRTFLRASGARSG